MLNKARADRDEILNPKGDGLPWPTLRELLAIRPEVDVLMRSVWKFRDERFLKSTRDFTEFLILRELESAHERQSRWKLLGLRGCVLPPSTTLATTAYRGVLGTKV